jgi:hypothetical protein
MLDQLNFMRLPTHHYLHILHLSVYEWIIRETQSTAPVEGKGARPAQCNGDLEIDNVSFAYPQRPERVRVTMCDQIVELLSTCCQKRNNNSNNGGDGDSDDTNMRPPSLTRNFLSCLPLLRP